ncbi:MAG: hypothetical protein JW847_04070 [Candidatus Omnitrophica bacterium]|nr:hypothetical protein [Candidatus Omnitrophota bacterium]
MPPRHPWIWKTYLIIALVFTFKNVAGLFMPDSESFLYYLILRVFHPFFYIIYTSHVLQVLLGAIHCIPLFLYTYRIRFLSADFWKALFILRCIFDVTGHSFELNSLISVYQSKPQLFWSVLAIFVIPHIPSYLACYWYAFQQEKVFS